MEIRPTTEQWASPPVSSKDTYIEACKKAVEDDVFDNFFQLDFGNVLGGNEYVVGQCAVNDLKARGQFQWFKDELGLFKDLERVGNPPKFDYGELGTLAPTTIRYGNAAIEVASLVEDISVTTVVEIGGGYGAMCVALSKLCSWDSYVDIDLPEAFALAKKYAAHFGLSLGEVLPETFDLFIADSSMAELGLEEQKRYAKLASQAKYVYITYNTLHTEIGREAFNYLLLALSLDHEVKVRQMALEQEGSTGGILCVTAKKKWPQ